MNTLDTLNREGGVRRSVGRMMRLTWLCAGVGILLYACLLLPLYSYLSNDVMFRGAWWLQAIGLLAELVDTAVILVICPITIYALWVGGFRRAWGIPLSYALLTILKYIANYVAGCIADGYVPGAAAIREDLSLILPMIWLELLQYALITGFALLHAALYRRAAARRAGYDALAGGAGEQEVILPLSRFFAWKNPVARALFDASIILLLLRLVNHIMYQMTLIVWTGVTDSPVQLIVDVVGDLIVAVVCYLLGILLVNAFCAHDAKKNA